MQLYERLYDFILTTTGAKGTQPPRMTTLKAPW